MGWLNKLTKRSSTGGDFRHDAPALEGTLPQTVAGRRLARWSVASASFWEVAGGDRVRSSLTPKLESVGLLPSDIEMAVAGREDANGPPYIVWALRFGALTGAALKGPVPSALAMDLMHVDANQGENWRGATIAGRRVLVGNRAMVHQDDHHRGLPYVCLTSTTIYAIIADDEAWAGEVIAGLPVDDFVVTSRWFGEFAEQAIADDARELQLAVDDAIRNRLGPDPYWRIVYHLRIEPRFRRMFSTRLLLSPTDASTLIVQIPVGTDKRRASLTDGGWTVDRTPSGTKYYSKVLRITEVAAAEVVGVIVEAYKLRYGNRVEGLSWALFVDPMHDELPVG